VNLPEGGDIQVTLGQISNELIQIGTAAATALRAEGDVLATNRAILLQASAHKKTADSLATLLGRITSDEVFRSQMEELGQVETRLNNLKQLAGTPPNVNAGMMQRLSETRHFISASELIALHHAACAAFVITSEQLSFLEAAIIHPTVRGFLISKGVQEPDPALIAIYTKKVVEMIKSPGLLSMIEQTMSFNAAAAADAAGGDADATAVENATKYQSSVGELNALCHLTCMAIYDNDGIMAQLGDIFASFYNFETLKVAIKRILIPVTGGMSVNYLFPSAISPFKALFEMGIEATGLVVSFAWQQPIFYMVLGSHVIVNKELYYSLITENALKVKQFAMNCIPDNLLARPRQVSAADAAAALSAAGGGVGGVAGGVAENSAVLLGILSVDTRGNLLKPDTAFGMMETCVRKLCDVCMSAPKRAIGLFKEAAGARVANMAVNLAFDFIETFVNKVRDMRDRRCSSKSRVAPPTYKMRSAFLELLRNGVVAAPGGAAAEAGGGVPVPNFDLFKKEVGLIIHSLSLQCCVLTETLVLLHDAFDFVVTGGSIFRTDEPTSDDSQKSNFAVASSPVQEMIQRALTEQEHSFSVPDSGGPAVCLDVREVYAVKLFEPQFLPQHNWHDFRMWLLLAKSLAPQDAAELAKQARTWNNPFLSFLLTISSIPPSAEPSRTVEDMMKDRHTPPQIVAAFKRFQTYIAQVKQLKEARAINPKQLECVVKCAVSADTIYGTALVPLCVDLGIDVDVALPAEGGHGHALQGVAAQQAEEKRLMPDAKRSRTTTGNDDATPNINDDQRQGVEVPVAGATAATTTFSQKMSDDDYSVDPTALGMNSTSLRAGKSRTHRRRAATTKRSRRKAYNKKSNKRNSRKQLSRKKISRRRQSRRK
jgi:hypothetical protein